MLFKQVQNRPYKQEIVNQFVKALLAKKILPGEKLPPERDLASTFGISRPVIHDALIDLEKKGVICIQPRQGSFVKDFRKEGSIDLVLTLLSCSSEVSQLSLMGDIFELRRLFGKETSFLAAEKITSKGLEELERIMESEVDNNQFDAVYYANKDYAFHHQIALISGNSLYPMLLNSFHDFLIKMLVVFFDHYKNNHCFKEDYKKVLKCLNLGDAIGAANTMNTLLLKAEKLFRQIPLMQEVVDEKN